jgi:hypothetical protein
VIEPTADRSPPARWLIADHDGRWLNAARRFAAPLTPPPWVASVERSAWPPVERSAWPPVDTRRAAGPRAVLLWELAPDQFAEACDRLATTSLRWPESLRLVAADRLSDPQRIVLAELGAAITINHPEQLPGLSPMIRAYFTRPIARLDGTSVTA